MKLVELHAGWMALILVLVFCSIGIGDVARFKPVAEFTDAAEAKKWFSVNDNVMGGVSEGDFRINDQKNLEFSGTLSLERQGGFASIRTRPADLGLDGSDAIVVRVKGDGRTYYLDLRTSAVLPASSYRAPLKTQKDTWQEIRIPLKEFEFAAFGRRLANADRLSGKDIQSVGFMLADKQAGGFRLEIAWIKAEQSDNADTSPAATRPAAADGPKDIVETAVAAGQFKTLLAAAKAAGLVDALKGKGPLTVFGPNDEAFAKVPKGVIDDLLKPENREALKAVLRYHVVPGKILLGAQSPATLEGRPRITCRKLILVLGAAELACFSAIG